MRQLLLNQFKPEHYDLLLTLDPSAKTFQGTVTIRGKKLGRPAQRITLHQRNLLVTAATITKFDPAGDQPVELLRINRQSTFDELRLHTKHLLYPGSYTITINFHGRITDAMLGIYPSYFEHDGQQKFLLATQFESHYAREAFPCIDEPAAKATFQLTLTTPVTDVVLSNTLPESEKIIKQHKTTVFKPTPPMSSYLLAFVCGDLQCVEATTKDGVLVRSWASPAQPKVWLEYSVQEAVKLLDFYSDYFGVAYPLEKCDQVALPDFDAGAMENWGLITYREVALLIDPANPSISSQQYVSLVIAHELSHQWFGNLVTMQWWDDLWLNESFASLMEHLALDHLHPDWQQWEAFVSSDGMAAATRDIYHDVQPVGVKVTDPELIDSLFDPAIVYAKGARLLKMLCDYLGDADFQTGLRSYFKALAYQNARRDDLWGHLAQASTKDIQSLMTPWLEQSGMPLVNVSQRGPDLLIRQERFILDKPDDTSRWPIPLLASSSLTPDLLQTTEAVVRSPGQEVWLNYQASGHYLVRYESATQRQALARAFAKGQLSVSARIDLVNTHYLLARRGDYSLTQALDLIAGAARERRDSVWAEVLKILRVSGQLTEGNETCRAALNHFKVKLASPGYSELGWSDQPGDDPNNKRLRHTLLSLMIGGEDKAAINQALHRYQQTSQITDIPAEIRNTILAAAVQFGKKPVVADLLKTYPKVAAEVQLDISLALASTQHVETAASIINQVLGPKGIARPQDVMRWLVAWLRNYYSRPVAWQWLKDNWDWLYETLGTSKSLDALPTYCANVISTADWQAKYREFFEPKQDIKMLRRNIQVGLADIASRVAWRQRDEAKITAWLIKHA